MFGLGSAFIFALLPALFFFLIILFIILAVLGLSCCTKFSLVAARGRCSSVAVLGLLIAEASLVEVYGL